MGARWGTWFDAAVACALASLVVAPLAVLAAEPSPLPAPPPAALAPVAAERPRTVLPVFTSAAARDRARAALTDGAAPALLERELEAALDAVPPEQRSALRRPGLRLELGPSALDSPPLAPDAARRDARLDLAALLLAAEAAGRLPNGGAAAEHVLAALPANDCPARLNAALIALSSDDGEPEAALDAARTACPGEPTPDLLATARGLSDPTVPERAVRDDPARSRQLRADRRLVQARYASETAPFTGRQLAGQALRSYDAVDGVPDAEVGAADALLLLNRPEEALRRLQALPRTGPVAERTAAVLEVLQRPGEAADVLAAAPDPDPVDLLPAASTVDEAVLLPGSLGATTATPVRLGPRVGLGLTGATVLDVSFVPQWRTVPGVTGPLPGCRTVQRARDEAAAGRVAVAARLLASSPCDDRPSRLSRVLAALGQGDLVAAERTAQDEAVQDLPPVEDDVQELQRWAGDLGAARATVRRWAADSPTDPTPLLREAELAFLEDDHGTAARLADASARLATEVERGAALLVAGAARAADPDRREDAVPVLVRAEQVLRPLTETLSESPLEPDVDVTTGDRAGYLLLQARLQRGTVLLELGRPAQAAEAFDGAADSYGGLYVVPGARPQLADLGLALASLSRGEPERGLAPARAAVDVDPQDPLALLDLAFVERRTGDLAAAEATLRRALRADPAFGLAALDLGTLLAEQRRDEEAAVLLRRALAREPGSAPGWHTLGVVLSRGGPGRQLQAQAAYARAAREDRDFRGRERVATYDDRVYVSRLDLSKPLPPDWSFTTTEQRLPASALASAALLGLAGYVRGRAVGKVVKRVEDRARTRLELVRRLPVHVLPAVAVVGTLGVLLLPVVRAGLPAAETAAAGAGIAVLLLALVRLRRRLGPPPMRHVASTPALVVGVVGAVTGLAGYAPVPAAAETGGDARVHRAGPVLLLSTGLLLLALATVTEVPLVRVLATSSLAMAAVCLTPLPPFDGPYVRAPRATRVVALLGTGIAIGLAVGLL